jgi:hypothetical protein
VFESDRANFGAQKPGPPPAPPLTGAAPAGASVPPDGAKAQSLIDSQPRPE